MRREIQADGFQPRGTGDCCSPDFLLGAVFDLEVDEDGPQVRPLGITRQDLVQHVPTRLWIAVTELQLSKLGNHIDTCEGDGDGYVRKETPNGQSWPTYFLWQADSLAPSAGEHWQRRSDPAAEGRCRSSAKPLCSDGNASPSFYTSSLLPEGKKKCTN